ncbi:MAG: hypothetical protein ABWY93_11560 [Mycobacterium sp.]
MKIYVISTAAAGALAAVGALAAAAAIGFAGTASALPSHGPAVTGGLSHCNVAGLRPPLGDSATLQEKAHTAVFVDLACPPE